MRYYSRRRRTDLPEVRAAYEAGASMAALQAKFGIAGSMVCKWAKIQGWQRPKKDLTLARAAYESGKPVANVAMLLGLSKKTVAKIVKREAWRSPWRKGPCVHGEKRHECHRCMSECTRQVLGQFQEKPPKKVCRAASAPSGRGG